MYKEEMTIALANSGDFPRYPAPWIVGIAESKEHAQAWRHLLTPKSAIVQCFMRDKKPYVAWILRDDAADLTSDEGGE